MKIEFPTSNVPLVPAFALKTTMALRINQQVVQAGLALVAGFISPALLVAGTPAFTIQLDTLSSGFDQKSCWVHPRIGVVPGATPAIVLTMQKAMLNGSDIFFGLSEMRSDDSGRTWSPPVDQSASLGRRNEAGGIVVSGCDYWPKWHARSGKLLAIGHTVRYRDGRVDPTTAGRTVYSIYDPALRTWTPWAELEVPDPVRFFKEGSGSAQRVDLPDGDILLPTHFKVRGEKIYRSLVMRCGFDGRRLSLKEIGAELHLNIARGLVEPSLARFRGRYHLTLRNDKAAYVSTSDDGLHFSEPRPWRWDDGADLGSYDTQAHWVTHDEAMFLVYTRRGANNDHIPRNRAPLFISQVDPSTLQVIRATERELMPQRGAKLGNFGVTEVNENETWVTDAEWMQTKPPNFADFSECMKYGSDNAVFAARIRWESPNRDWNQH